MKQKIDPRTKKCIDRYKNKINRLIWKGFSAKEIAKKCNLDPSIISDEVKRFGSEEDKKKIKENGKIKLLNDNKLKTNFGENNKRLEKSKKLFFEKIKPLIWKGVTSVDIANILGYTKNGDICIRKHIKRFGREEDYKQLLQNGINKRRDTLILLMKNKTSVPEKMLFDIIKEIYPSAKHKYKIINDKNYYWEMDVAIPEIKLNIEYDGEYWHKNNRDRDYKRDLFLISKGWKIIRIEYKDSPTYETLLKEVMEKCAFQ